MLSVRTHQYRFATILFPLMLMVHWGGLPGAVAQTQSCQEELAEANNQYARGQFDQTITLLDQCLEKTGISEQERRTAYRLKGLSFIGKGLEVDAQESIRRLLQVVPNYEPDPVEDPPDFVKMVNEIKDEVNRTIVDAQPQNDTTPTATTPTTTVSEPQQSRRRGGGRWVIAGLGVAAAGTVACILLCGDGGGGGDIISEPPPLP